MRFSAWLDFISKKDNQDPAEKFMELLELSDQNLIDYFKTNRELFNKIIGVLDYYLELNILPPSNRDQNSPLYQWRLNIEECYDGLLTQLEPYQGEPVAVLERLTRHLETLKRMRDLCITDRYQLYDFYSQLYRTDRVVTRFLENNKDFWSENMKYIIEQAEEFKYSLAILDLPEAVYFIDKLLNWVTGGQGSGLSNEMIQENIKIKFFCSKEKLRKLGYEVINQEIKGHFLGPDITLNFGDISFADVRVTKSFNIGPEIFRRHVPRLRRLTRDEVFTRANFILAPLDTVSVLMGLINKNIFNKTLFVSNSTNLDNDLAQFFLYLLSKLRFDNTNFPIPTFCFQNSINVTHVTNGILIQNLVGAAYYSIYNSAPFNSSLILGERSIISPTRLSRINEENSALCKIVHIKIFPYIGEGIEVAQDTIVDYITDGFPSSINPMFNNNQIRTAKQKSIVDIKFVSKYTRNIDETQGVTEVIIDQLVSDGFQERYIHFNYLPLSPVYPDSLIITIYTLPSYLIKRTDLTDFEEDMFIFRDLVKNLASQYSNLFDRDILISEDLANNYPELEQVFNKKKQ